MALPTVGACEFVREHNCECIYQRHVALSEGFRDLSTYVPYFLITIFEPKERSKRIEEEKIEQEEERRVGQCGRGRFMYN